MVAHWLENANRDYDAAEHLLAEGDRFGEIAAFHCQQAVEKYLKALLVRYQVEFPKTHDIRKLLGWVATIHPDLAESLRDADTLTEVRYPSDAPELLPGGETDAFSVASRVREAVMALLKPYLAEG